MNRPISEDEDGSTLILVIGYAALALAVCFVCVCATSLHLAQRQLEGIADAAALAASDGFHLETADGGVRTALDPTLVSSQAQSIVDAAAHDVTLVEATTPDGSSARVTVRGMWDPPLFSPFVPDGITLEATATSRVALAG